MSTRRIFSSPQRSQTAAADRPAFASRPWARDQEAPGAVPSPTGPGKPLPEAIRQKMERAFGQDFQDVRLHLGGEAAMAGAIAFARRSEIHLPASRFDPVSQQGQRLLGHELAHVVQQRQGRVSAHAGGSPIVEEAGLETEAEAAGVRVAQGQTAQTGALGRVSPAMPATPLSQAPAQPMRRWGPPGSKATFLQDPNEGKTEEEIWPSLSGSSSGPSQVVTRLPTAAEQWAAAPAPSAAAPAPADPLAGIKERIQNWDRSTHDGMNAEHLTDEQIAELQAWAGNVRSKSGKTSAFDILRGTGSGAYEGTDQVKIVSRHYDPIGDKKPTFHVTVRR